MSAHTPGPWHVGPEFDNDGYPEIIIERKTPAGNLVVAVALPGLQGQKSNAHLIAAAPDLLNALSVVLRDVQAVDAEGHLADIELEPAMYQARAAIAKATGGAA